MRPEIEKVISDEALLVGIDPRLALAFAEVESAGDPLAVRYEAHWKYYFDVPQFAYRLRITQETERNLQSLSWGLMQVMGSVARELGFVESLITLSDPHLGAKYGCMKLKQCMRKYPIFEDAIASYNAGSPRKLDGHYVNQGYVDKIKLTYKRICRGAIAQS